MTLKALQDAGTPTGLTDSQATALGMKQYVAGNTYANGVTFNITSAAAGFSLTRFVAIPYQLSDGTWRMKYNGMVQYSSDSAEKVFTCTGVTTKNISPYYQIVNVAFLDGVQANVKYGYWDFNASTFRIRSVAAETYAIVQGDIELESKPTWAY